MAITETPSEVQPAPTGTATATAEAQSPGVVGAVADAVAPPSRPSLAVEPGWELLVEKKPAGILRRALTTQRHLLGMLGGLLTATLRDRPPEQRSGFKYYAARAVAGVVWPFLDRKLRNLPFPVQFRRRLEILGPTYIKLGQVLALREDLLPSEVTDELKNLLDRLPVVPFDRYCQLITESLDRPIDQMFSWIDPRPLGSASIAQTHRATTREGDVVILKVVKPGIRSTLRRDSVLLKSFGSFLQIFLGRFQPKRVLREFVDYTLREVDLRLEADNAETFAANFKDLPDVVFPKIYRQYSSDRVLTMEFLDGFKPNDPRALALSDEDRDRLVDLGSAAIIRMLYKDGFFHADLHPGNLMVLPGPKAGFIDLGMVGRFEDELRRTLLYYFYCLVMGDAEHAAHYLLALAARGPGADPQGFRREVTDISRRWQHAANFADFSLAQLIMESVGKAGKYRMYFPVEMVLMVKALVTFEGVGQVLKPGFDVAAVSQTHVNKIFLYQFSPLRLVKESLRGAPEIVDAMVKTPMLITEGLKVLEQATRRPPENPFTGIRGTLFAGFMMLAAAILAGNQLWIPAGVLGLLGLALALRPGR